MGSERESADSNRRQAYLRCACSALNFDVGEIWSWQADDKCCDDGDDILGLGGSGGGRGGVRGWGGRSMRFIQLYTSPSFRSQRSKLVTPSEDWEQSERDVSKHKFSPTICEAVREGEVVWAITPLREGLLGRSDLPLRTAVGVPVCGLGRDLCVLVLFSPYIVQKSTSAMQFLFTLSKAASDSTQVFLPASTSAPVRPIQFPARWRRDTHRRRQRLAAIRARLPCDVIFETLALGQSPHPEHAICGAMLQSVYNHNATIPSEGVWPRGGGAFGNSIYGSSNGSSGSGTIIGGGVFSDRQNRFQAPFSAGGGGGGSSAHVPLSAGGGLGTGGAAFIATGQSISSIDRPLSRTSRSLSPLDLRGGGAGGQTPSRMHRRGSGTSAASSMEWGMLASAGDQASMDSDEYYNLWAAFMEPDSPPRSPSYCDSASPLHGEEDDDNSRDDGEGLGVEKEQGEEADASSFRSLSALLSGGVGGETGADDDDDDDDDGLGTNQGVGMSTVQQSSPMQVHIGSHNPPIVVKKEELVEEDWSGSDSMGCMTPADIRSPGNGSVTTRVNSRSCTNTPASPQSSLPSSSLASTTAGGSISIGAGGTTTPGALRAAQNSAAADRAAAVETRCFTANAMKRARFDEFINGFLSVSVFHAADVWLPLMGNNGRGEDEPSRLFLFHSVAQDPRLGKWRTLSQNVELASGVGVPGLVFQERRSQWAVDYSQVDPARNPLASIAGLLGIGSAFGVPLPLGSHECGVVMLYSMSCLAPSELVVEFVERATGLLLADVPVSDVLRQQFREKLPSAEGIDRVAGAYQHRTKWAERHQRSRGARDAASSSPDASGSWGGSGTALAVAAAAAAGGGQGGGFRADGGAVAFIPPADWPASDTPAPPLVYNRVDLDGRRSSADDLEAAVAGFARFTPKMEFTGHEHQQQPQQPNMVTDSGDGQGDVAGFGSVGFVGQVAGREGAAAAAAVLAAEEATTRAATVAAGKAKAAAAEREGAMSGGRRASLTGTAGFDGGGQGGRTGTVVEGMMEENSEAPSATCRTQGCENRPTGRTSFCWEHWSAARQCQNPGCDKLSQGNTRLCIAHGGGRRCTHPGCNKGARDRFFCAAHGGGKRCSVAGCGKAAVGGSDLCTGHGGGKRCQYPDCPKSAQSKTNFCVRHGGGRKCSVKGCLKVARGRTSHCAAHGGGVRCCIDGCNKAAVGRERMCRSHQRKSKTASASSGASQPVASAQSTAAGNRRGGGSGGGGASSVTRTPSFPTALSALSAAAVAHAATDLLDLGSPATSSSSGSRGNHRGGEGGCRKRPASAIAGGKETMFGAGVNQRYRNVAPSPAFPST